MEPQTKGGRLWVYTPECLVAVTGLLLVACAGSDTATVMDEDEFTVESMTTLSLSAATTVPPKQKSGNAPPGDHASGASDHAWANEFVRTSDLIAKVSVVEVITSSYGTYMQAPPVRPTSTAYWFRGRENTVYEIVRLDVEHVYKGQVGQFDGLVVALPVSTVADEQLPSTMAFDVAEGDEAIVLAVIITEGDPVANLVAEHANAASGNGNIVRAAAIGRWYGISNGLATSHKFPTEQYALGTLENILEVVLGTATPSPGATPFGR